MIRRRSTKKEKQETVFIKSVWKVKTRQFEKIEDFEVRKAATDTDLINEFHRTDVE